MPFLNVRDMTNLNVKSTPNDINMKKKEIMIELVNDIPSLIRIQELSLIELKKTIRNQQVIDFQEDILRILKAVNKMDFINLDSN